MREFYFAHYLIEANFRRLFLRAVEEARIKVRYMELTHLSKSQKGKFKGEINFRKKGKLKIVVRKFSKI